MKENILKIVSLFIVIFITSLITFTLVTYKYERYRNEDVNKDGIVDVVDLIKVQKYIIEKNEIDRGE